MTVRINQFKLPLDFSEKPLAFWLEKRLRINRNDIVSCRIVKKSVDARDKGDVKFSLTVDIVFKDGAKLPKDAVIAPEAESIKVYQNVKLRNRPLVIGLGPAGLFAALTLARAGSAPIVIERGKPVDERTNDVNRFFETGILDTKSNVLFGEGGAGAFSDGKLNTGIKDPRCHRVLETLYEHGAPEDILYNAKPHVGTDLLCGAVKSIRNEIIRLGGTVLFEHTLKKIVIDDNKIKGAVVSCMDGDKELICDDIILAIGHSARDTFKMLYDSGVFMTQKPFSIGVRIEHPQKLINQSQYGKFADNKYLGAADYKLSERLKNGRGVYTFCMCPGGRVIASASEENMVVTNGMSLHARDGKNANSALLVSVEPSDFMDEHPLAGVEFQRKWERAAYEAGGGGYIAPAQLAGDFLKKQASVSGGSVEPTYKPGVKWTDLSKCLPDFAVDGLRQALPVFGRKIKGFDSNDAVMTGIETRSSSPVRINRDINCVASISGLYPCGEGAGYAGGIMSAAVDGMKCAEGLLSGYSDD